MTVSWNAFLNNTISLRKNTISDNSGLPCGEGIVDQTVFFSSKDISFP